MIARKAPSGKERGRRSSSRLGAVRLRAGNDTDAAENPAGAASGQSAIIATRDRNEEGGSSRSLVLKAPKTTPLQDAGLQQPPAAMVGQDNPWDYVQDAFRRLADPSMESGSPLSLDTLMSGRPALLDKGLGAINAVGKAAVHVANSLDNAVETLFEGWNGSAPPAAEGPESTARRQAQKAGAMRLDGSSQKRPITPQSSKKKQATHDSAASGDARQSQRQPPLRAAKENEKPAQEEGCPSRPNTPLGSSGGQEDSETSMLTESTIVGIRHHDSTKQQGSSPGGDEAFRLQQMQEELATLQATKREYLQLREQMSRVQGELDVLSRENKLLKEKRQQEPCMPPPLACDDPLAEQVAGQLQALLQEKARLASENARLAHENTSLQELLEYTVRSVDSAPTDRSEDECSSAGGEGDWGDDLGCVSLEAATGAHPSPLDMHGCGADQVIAVAGAM